MEPAALVRELQREVLTTMLRTEDEERPDGVVVLLEHAGGLRTWEVLPEPGPDDLRASYLEREVGALILERAPDALAVATAVKGVPEPHETLVIWAAERGGETLAMRMHTVLTGEGLLVPGPIGELDTLEAELARTWVEALRAAG